MIRVLVVFGVVIAAVTSASSQVDTSSYQRGYSAPSVLDNVQQLQQIELQRQQIEMQRLQLQQQKMRMQEAEMQRQLEFERQQAERYRQQKVDRAKASK